jgi:hypothetical protein
MQLLEPRWVVPPVWRKDLKTKKQLFLEGGIPDFRAALADLPQGHDWRHTYGTDLGYLPDPFACVCWAWAWTCPKMIEVFSFAQTEMDSDDQLAWMMGAAEIIPPSIVVGDVGGANRSTGKGWSKRWMERFGFGIEEAEKHHKHEAIQLFNTDLRKRRIVVRKGSPLHEQLRRVQWLPVDGRGKMEEDPSIPNDLTDGGLYGHRRTYQHLAKPEAPPPRAGSPEYYAKLEAEYEDDSYLYQEPESYYG